MRIQNYGDDGDERRRRLRGYHPPACTCFRCNEERLAKEVADEEGRRAGEYDRRIAASRPQSRGQPRPHAQSSPRQERPRDERNRPFAILRRWLLIGAVITGVVLLVLFVGDCDSSASPGEGDSAMAAVPPPTETAPPEDQEPTPTVTPTPSENREASSLSSVPIPSPSPPSKWELACPDCPVVFLNASKPEVKGASKLRAGQPIKIVGCTDARTTIQHRYLFRSLDGSYTGMVTFSSLNAPGPVTDLKCFEMLGEYKGTNHYSVDKRWMTQAGPRHLLARTAMAEITIGPRWETIGLLASFRVTEWAEYSSVQDAMAGKLLGPLPTATPTPDHSLSATPDPTSTPTPRPTSTPAPTSTPRPTPTPTPTYEETAASIGTLMLDLINEERIKAGVGPVVMGSNGAAQVHAENALEGCFSGHWGLDGTKQAVHEVRAGRGLSVQRRERHRTLRLYQTGAAVRASWQHRPRNEAGHGWLYGQPRTPGEHTVSNPPQGQPGHRFGPLQPMPSPALRRRLRGVRPAARVQRWTAGFLGYAPAWGRP